MSEFKAKRVILEFCHLPHGVTSQDVPEHLIPKDDNNCAGLPHTLQLALEAQVMLRRNIICEDGLVNGARGVMWNSSGQVLLTIKINLEAFLHDPRVGQNHSILVPGCDVKAVKISPILARFFAQQGVTLQRTGLPPFTRYKVYH